MDINEARIYVGTYGKYNEGSLFGDWLDLADYSSKEEFFEAIKELHSDEIDEYGDFQGEPMYQDWENIPECFIGESWVSDKFWELLDVCKDWDEDKFNCFVEYCEEGHATGDDITEMTEKFEDNFVGFYDSEEDFAEEYANENNDIPEHLMGCIDWERYTHNIMQGYYYIGGAIFYA